MKLVHAQLVLRQSIIFLALYAVALSMRSQFSLVDSQDLPHQNSTVCPSVWFEYNQATHDWQCNRTFVFKL